MESSSLRRLPGTVLTLLFIVLLVVVAVSDATHSVVSAVCCREMQTVKQCLESRRSQCGAPLLGLLEDELLHITGFEAYVCHGQGKQCKYIVHVLSICSLLKYYSEPRI
jgi:hypothetical protein